MSRLARVVPANGTPTRSGGTGSASGSANATPTRIPRRRGPITYSPTADNDNEEGGSTPGPVKARIDNLMSQVQELLRKQHAAERKHRAEILVVERRLTERDETIIQMKIDSAEGAKRAVRVEKELARSKTQGAVVREDVALASHVEQQKSVLVTAEQGLKVLELEQRLVQADVQCVLRDHRVSLASSREADAQAELSERESRIAELEDELAAANTSLSHRRAAETKAQVESFNDDEVLALKLKVSSLEKKLARAEEVSSAAEGAGKKDAEEAAKLRDTVARLREKTRALEAQVAEGGKGDDKSTSELRAQLRAAKAEAARSADEAEDARAELETSREREKTLKAKIQEAHQEQLRLAGVEEELAAMKASSKTARKRTTAASETEASPPKKARGRPKKTATASPKKAASPEKKATKRAPKTSLESLESDSDAELMPKKKAEAKSAPARVPEAVAEESQSPQPAEKKKKRKLLGGAAPAFQWDSILNSGDGVIPTYLSPVSSRTTATIPRAALGRKRF